MKVTETQSKTSQPVAIPATPQRMSSTTLAYVGLLIFTFAYYIRPEDWTSTARMLPLASIGGTLAILGFVISYVKNGRLSRLREVPLFLALLGWFIVVIPFSTWPGGSFLILNSYIWKISILSVVLVNVIDTTNRLRLLLTIQVIGVGLIAITSYGNVDEKTGRLMGVSQAFGNSNDLASMIAITLPICFYLIVTSHGIMRLNWACASMGMVYILLLTLSRTGFLALMTALFSLAWYFLVKQRRFATIIGLIILVTFSFLVAAPQQYKARILSIFIPSLDVNDSRKDATGSREGRINLLWKSVEVTIDNPFFGVGPGQMEVASGNWLVSHNTFLQFTSESGIPGLVIFLLLLRTAFRNLRESEIRVPKGYNSDTWVLVGVLRASLLTFILAAIFSNFGYEFFTYFLIAFTAALNQIVLITCQENEFDSQPELTGN